MTPTTYLHTRVYDELGIAPEQQKILLRSEHPEYGYEQEYNADIFTSTREDDISILVYTLDRQLITYDHKDADHLHNNINNNRTQHYHLVRINPTNLKDGMPKYLMPKGKGIYPFIPPTLVDKFDNFEPIETLYLTEGIFKAMKASVHGLDIVGLTSITHYADSRTKQMHPDIIRIIEQCKVKNVVMLYDGDCLDISLKDLQNQRDLNNRPQRFYASMVKTFELLKDYNVKVWFSHINSDRLGGAKGLDDVLVAFKFKEEKIIDDLLDLNKPGFAAYRLSVAGNFTRLQAYFNLKTPEMFYHYWSEHIKGAEFSFFGTNYQHNENTGKLDKTMPKELKNFMRVGDDFFEMIEMPTLYGNSSENITIDGDTEMKMHRRNKSTITDDFGKDALKKIPKYKSFINIPSHTNYQQVIRNCYNQYSQIKHEPKQGDCSTILNFIMHIFGEQYELGLDYIQILYQYPTQILPILCLVSKERHTGKTTFLDLLKMIFGENCAKVGNAEISSQFNSFLTSRLIVGVDETSLENNRDITERIKMLSTTNRIFSQAKGVDYTEQWHFAKYILTSNFETNFIYTQEDEIRFWVRKIPQIKQSDAKHTFLQDIYEEIPAFLFLLANRKLSTKKASRMWFTPEQIETEALRALKEKQKPLVQREIVSYVRQLLLDFREPQVLLTVEVLKAKIPALQRKDDTHINNILRENMKLSRYKNKEGKEAVTRFSVPYFEPGLMIDDPLLIKREKFQGRPFVFTAAQFLTENELKEIEG